MVLSDFQGLDTERAIRMALLHDMVETEIGDLTPEQKELRGDTCRREEREAMKKILSVLPADLEVRYRTLWEDLRERESLEAIVVAQADVIEMLLQALEYEEAGVDPKALERFWHTSLGEGLHIALVKAMKKRRGES